MVLFNRALEIDENHTRAMNGKALTLDYLGKPEEAIVLFDRLLEVKWKRYEYFD